MDTATFHRERQFAETRFGKIAYVERGAGPTAVFLHGMPLNGYQWRFVMDGLSDIRRCLAPDLMGLGYTEIASDQDLSFISQAAMVRAFLDTLEVDQVDIVGNDTGGGIAQIFTAFYPERVRSLTLCNCEVQDMWPTQAVQVYMDAAKQGTLVEAMRRLLEDPAAARSGSGLAAAYANPSVLTDDAIRVYIGPLVSSDERVANFHRYWNATPMPAVTVVIEPLLRSLAIPVLIVWAQEDTFFDPRSARWLKEAIPEARLVEVSGAKLYFAEDRPEALIEPLREMLTSRVATATGRV